MLGGRSGVEMAWVRVSFGRRPTKRRRTPDSRAHIEVPKWSTGISSKVYSKAIRLRYSDDPASSQRIPRRRPHWPALGPHRATYFKWYLLNILNFDAEGSSSSLCRHVQNPEGLQTRSAKPSKAPRAQINTFCVRPIDLSLPNRWF